MSSLARRQSISRILIDLNTQYDFLLPSGALPVANRADILLNIRRLMNWARIERIPVISTLEAHRPGESVRGLPPHCIDNSNGQKKLPFTLLPKRVLLHGDNTLDLPHEPFRRYQQLIFTKRHRDFLTNPKADRLVHQLDADHVVVFGVVGEFCVKAAVLGLMARQQQVVVVTDGCGFWAASDWELACRQMEAKGAILVTSEELIGGQAEERIRAAARPAPVVEDEFAFLTVRSSHSNGNGNGNGGGDGYTGHQQTALTSGAGRSNGNGQPKPANGHGQPPAETVQLPADADGWSRPAPAKSESEDSSGLVHPEILAQQVRKAVRKPKSRPDLA